MTTLLPPTCQPDAVSRTGVRQRGCGFGAAVALLWLVGAAAQARACFCAHETLAQQVANSTGAVRAEVVHAVDPLWGGGTIVRVLEVLKGRYDGGWLVVHNPGAESSCRADLSTGETYTLTFWEPTPGGRPRVNACRTWPATERGAPR